MKRFGRILWIIASAGGVCLSVQMLRTQAQIGMPRQNGAIAGRIILPDGTPGANVRVAALTEPDGPAKARQPQSPGNSRRIPDDSTLIGLTRTDGEGRYHLESIPPGRYYIILGTFDEPVYFPGVRTFTKATIVPVASGTLETRDFNLNIPLALKVSGRVIREGHQVGATVTLNGATTAELRAAIATDGSFEFAGVRPGTYQLRIAPNLTAPAPITIVVGDSDVEGLQIPVPHTAVRSVPVVFRMGAPEGAPLPHLKLRFTPVPSMAQTGKTVAVPSPQFEQEIPVGSYRVAVPSDFSLPTGYSVQAITAGSIDLLRTTLNIPASGVAPITIKFAVSAPPWIKLKGQITGFDKAPVRARKIAVTIPGFVSPLTAAVMPDGSFEFPFVLPGMRRFELEPAADAFSRMLLVSDSGLANAKVPMVISAVKVSGRVSAGTLRLPAAGVTAWLRPEAVAPGLQSFFTPVAADGLFVFSEVPPGVYALSVACEEPRDIRLGIRRCPPLPAFKTLVIVTDKNIANLVIPVEASQRN